MRLRLFTASVLRSVLWRVPFFGARMPLRGVGPGAPARPARVLAVGGLGRVLRGSWRGLSDRTCVFALVGVVKRCLLLVEHGSADVLGSLVVVELDLVRVTALGLPITGGVVWPAGLASVCLANIAVSSEQCRGSASEARAHEIAIVATCENRADSFNVGAGHL